MTGLVTRILGIDPGSRITGYGIIAAETDRNHHLASGCIRLQDESLPQRLKQIFQSIEGIVQQYEPQELAIERVFMHHNADSALKLGQARGVAICAAVMHGLTVHEYAPRQIKQAVVGGGAAAKFQVQHMVKILLALAQTPPEDASDALAVALCHSHVRRAVARMPALAGGFRRARR